MSPIYYSKFADTKFANLDTFFNETRDLCLKATRHIHKNLGKITVDALNCEIKAVLHDIDQIMGGYSSAQFYRAGLRPYATMSIQKDSFIQRFFGNRNTGIITLTAGA